VDRFTPNQDQNNRRSILHITSTTFHQRKCFVLWYLSVIIGEDRHVAAAAWPSTYMLLHAYVDLFSVNAASYSIFARA